MIVTEEESKAIEALISQVDAVVEQEKKSMADEKNSTDEPPSKELIALDDNEEGDGRLFIDRFRGCE